MQKHVAEVLQDNGEDLNNIEAIVWRRVLYAAGIGDNISNSSDSHLHWDYTGSPLTFPRPQNSLLGPGSNSLYQVGQQSQIPAFGNLM